MSFKIGDKIQMRSDKWIKENLYFEIMFIGEQQMLGRVADGTECTMMTKPASSYKLYEEPKKNIFVAPALIQICGSFRSSNFCYRSAKEAIESCREDFIKWPYNEYSWVEVDDE